MKQPERRAPEAHETPRKTIDRAPTRFESKRATNARELAQARLEIRQKEAQQTVEARLNIEPNVDRVIDEVKDRIKDLEKAVDQLDAPDQQMQHELDLAKNQLSLLQERQQETSQEAEVIPLSESSIEDLPPTPPGFLGRLNSWLRGQGRSEKERVSVSSYDLTQTPQAKQRREQARQESVQDIADRALEANMRELEREQAELVKLEQKAKSASFLTRWRYSSAIERKRESIKFREAAIKARRAQQEAGAKEKAA